MLIAFGFSHYNSAYGAGSVPLLPIDSGNHTLDKYLPKFYDCIEDAVRSSGDEQKDPYFKDEPTRNEVTNCYMDTSEGKSLKRDSD
jgi:hypothetical protein